MTNLSSALPLDFVVYGDPKTKKNSQEIHMNKYTGKRWVSQSEKYKQYASDFMWQIRYTGEPINTPVNLKVVFYREKKTRVDLCNLLAATCDILVSCGVLADDNRNIVAAHDGSRVFFDKENPRAEISITPMEEGYQ